MKLKVVATSTSVRMSLGKAKLSTSAPAETPTNVHRSIVRKSFLAPIRKVL